jgi:hypothetical protein
MLNILISHTADIDMLVVSNATAASPTRLAPRDAKIRDFNGTIGCKKDL